MSEHDAKLAAVQARIRTLIADLSGYDEDDIDPTVGFLDLGFDSLFLTQIATALQNAFGVKIAFRQLIETLPTPEAVAAHVAPHVADAPAPAPEPTLATAPELSTAPALAVAPQPAAAARPIAPIAPNAAAAGPAALTVMAQQLELMQRQIALLAGASPAEATPVEIAAPAPVSAKAAPAAEMVEAASTPPSEPEERAQINTLPKRFSGDAGARDTAMDDAQRVHIERLTARYCAKTAGSKRHTQRHRTHFADPRTATGFNRAWKEVVYPIVVERSLGAHLWDVDGSKYVDLTNGFGPNFFGHNAPFIIEAVQKQMASGFEVGPQTRLAGETAEMFCEMTGLDRVTWLNTGSEAVQAAIRLARTVTGRDKIVMFAGDYHGNFDEVIVRGVASSKGRRTLPATPGVPRGSVGNVIVLDYGDMAAIDEIRAGADEIAAVLVEPIQSRRPELQPRAFLHALRAVTEETGAVLVFDEVITGFRTGPGGAQAHFGVKADLATYGKVFGGGMPIGAVAGSAALMDTFDGGFWSYGDDSFPTAGVTFFAGTFVRHPLAMAAAHAALSYMRAVGPDLQRGVARKGDRLASELRTFFDDRGVDFELPNFGSQLYLRIKEQGELANLFYVHMRDRGVHMIEGAPSYMTAAHSDADVDWIVDSAKDAVREMQHDGALPRPGDLRDDGWRRTAPLTDGQREIWMVCQIGPEASCAFNESDSITIAGELDRTALRAAVNDAFDAHEAFKIRIDADGLTQWIDPAAQVPLDEQDLSSVDAAERDAALARLYDREARTPFDLEAGPLFRAHLIRTAPDEHVFVLYAHHIAFDGFSADLLVREIAERYAARVENRPATPAQTTQFSVFAHAVARRDSDAARDARAHWLSVFEDGAPEPLDLPTDRRRPREPNFDGDTVRRTLPRATLDAVKAGARANGVSVASLCLTAYAALLARLSGADDVVVGAPAARQAAEDAPCVGYGVTISPIRARDVGTSTARDLAKRVQTAVYDAVEHQAFALSDLVRDLKLPRHPARLPLVEALFNYSGYFADVEAAGCRFSASENARRHVLYDLFLNVQEEPDGLGVSWDYAASLFDRATIDLWLDYYERLLLEFAARPDAPVGDLALSDTQALAARLERFNDTAASYPTTARVGDAFSAQAAAHGAKTALICGREAATYSELDAMAAEAAARLAAAGVGPGAIVGLHLDRSIGFVAAALGVWRVGAAYLPLDPHFPAARLEYMVQESGAACVISHPSLSATRPAFAAPIVELDGATAGAAPVDGARATDGESCAVVLYTSGSTGKPKGVAVSHRSIVNLLASYAREPGLTADDRLLAVSTFSFDISIAEIFAPLSVGATAIIAQRDEAPDGYALADLIEEHDATLMQATPATWRMMLDCDWAGAPRLRILTAGEPLTPDLAEGLLSRVAELWNFYGPTETTIYSTGGRVLRPDEITIGRPVANTRIEILDDHGAPTPPGVPGELWISGDGVSLGYLGRPELTTERFPSGADGARRYRTGDWARWRADGRIDFQRRRDDQVKVRGYRIELGEIETALAAHDAVAQAVAVVRTSDAPSDAAAQLVAYATPRSGAPLDPRELRQHLRRFLPDYMVPQFIVPLETFPKTASAKIDRKALPAPAVEQAPVADRRAPETERERQIAALWREILNLDQIDAEDNFFELGGTSLSAAQFVAQMKRRHDVRLSLWPIVTDTLAQLAVAASAPAVAAAE